MSGRIPVAKAIGLITFVTGLGFATMHLTTPTDQEFYDSLAPDLKRKVDDSRAAQKAARDKFDAIQALNASAEKDAPVWADSLPKK